MLYVKDGKKYVGHETRSDGENIMDFYKRKVRETRERFGAWPRREKRERRSMNATPAPSSYDPRVLRPVLEAKALEIQGNPYARACEKLFDARLSTISTDVVRGIGKPDAFGQAV